MVSLEEERADALQLLVHRVLLLSLCELAQSRNDWGCAKILHLPGGRVARCRLRGWVMGQHVEQILLATHKGLTEIHLACWELPLLSVSVPHDHVGAVLCCIVNRLAVLDGRVHVSEVL